MREINWKEEGEANNAREKVIDRGSWELGEVEKRTVQFLCTF